MGEEKEPQGTPEAPPVDKGAAAPNVPGHIPEPKEKDWKAEPADPYEGIDRSDPFEGRPETAVPRPEEPAGDAGEAPAPGQPLPRSDSGADGA